MSPQLLSAVAAVDASEEHGPAYLVAPVGTCINACGSFIMLLSHQ